MPVHDLHRRVTVLREHEQARAVSPVNGAVRRHFFEPGESPRPHKPIAIALRARRALAASQLGPGCRLQGD
jgi:hypothetical protein